jgi:hypothetical protein
MLRLLGIALILVSISFTAWWIARRKPAKNPMVILCLIAVFAGLSLIMNERATEITIANVGSIKGAAQQISDLKERIVAQGAAVDLVAKDAAEAKRIVEEVALKNLEADKKLAILDQTIQEANRALSELQGWTRFNSTVLAAQNDSRAAYDQLWQWKDDSAYPLQNFAAQAVQAIMDQHDMTTPSRIFDVPWKEGIYPQQLTIEQLRDLFQQSPPEIRAGIVNFVWEKRTDIPKKERLSFLLDVLRRDESLQVAEFAGFYFAQGTGDNLAPLAIPDHLEWWEQHNSKLE